MYGTCVQVTIVPIDCLPYTTIQHIQLSVIRDVPLDIGRGDEKLFCGELANNHLFSPGL